jgi:hypothetical protein
VALTTGPNEGDPMHEVSYMIMYYVISLWEHLMTSWI